VTRSLTHDTKGAPIRVLSAVRELTKEGLDFARGSQARYNLPFGLCQCLVKCLQGIHRNSKVSRSHWDAVA